jgi:homoserine dehydrogenase
MEQAGLGDEARLVFVTHTALEQAIAATIDDLQHLREVDAIGGIIRVIGHDEGDH